jgi:hypothetical protein
MTAMLATLPCCLCAAAGRSVPSTPWPGGEGAPICDQCRTECFERAAEKTTPSPPPDFYFLPQPLMGIIATLAPDKPADADTKIIDFKSRRCALIAARAIGHHSP